MFGPGAPEVSSGSEGSGLMRALDLTVTHSWSLPGGVQRSGLGAPVLTRPGAFLSLSHRPLWPQR